MKFIVVFLALFSVCSQAETFDIATGEYAPWTDSGSESGGFVNALITKAFERMGHSVKFHYMPWKRALEDTRSGKYVASSFWFYDAEREVDFIHSEPLYEDRTVFFKTKTVGLETWNDWDDLKPYQIGATIGYTYTPEFWALGESGELSLQKVSSDEVNMKKLNGERIQLFPVSEVTGWGLVKQLFPDKRAEFSFLKKPLAVVKGHLLFSKVAPNHDKLVTQFNAAMEQIRQDGTYENVRKKVLGLD